MVETYLLVGCLLSVVGSIIDNWGMNLQKSAHHMQKNVPLEERKAYTCQPQWIIGFAIYIFGQILNFVSLGLIDQPTQSILSSFALFSNLVFAKHYFNEEFKNFDLFGLFCVSSGASLFVRFFVHRKQQYTIQELEQQFYQPEFMMLMLVLSTFVVLCALYINNKPGNYSVLEKIRKSNFFQNDHSALAYAVIAAIVGGCTVTFSKIVSVMIRAVAKGDVPVTDSRFIFTILFIWVIFLLMSVHTLNVGLRNSPALVMIPIFYVLANMTSVAVGTIYFEEYETFQSVTLTALCAVGLGFTLTGIWLLSQRVASAKANMSEGATYRVHAGSFNSV